MKKHIGASLLVFIGVAPFAIVANEDISIGLLSSLFLALAYFLIYSKKEE